MEVYTHGDITIMDNLETKQQMEMQVHIQKKCKKYQTLFKSQQESTISQC